MNQLEKTYTLMGLSLGSLLITVMSSLNIGNIFWSLTFGGVFIALTSIFFILLSNKKLLLIYLAAAGLIIYLPTLFLGLASLSVTIILFLLSMFVLFFTYVGFLEIEKNQIISRLFVLSSVTKETIKILSTALIILISVNIFSSIHSQGSSNFVQDIISDEDVLTTVVMANGGLNSSGIGANRIFMTNSGNYGKETKSASFYNFLSSNYHSLTGNILSSDLSDEEESALLEKLRKEQFQNLPLTLTTKLNSEEFKLVTKSYYKTKIDNYENSKTDGGQASYAFIVNNVPKSTHLPAIVAIIVLLMLFLIRFVIVALASFIQAFIWKIFEFTGFIEIEIEMVEAEVVKL